MERASVVSGSDFAARLRLKEAAAYLAVSPRSLADRGWRLRLGIPCFKIGSALVFDRAALDRWLAKHQERQQAEGGAA
jgi:flavin-dependent dehydrogenase